MEPIKHVESIIVPLDNKNVDTDQIISKEFLKRIERTGFGQYLFYHWRYNEDGTLNEDFVLNDPKFAGASILVSDENFGCGSSREHAPWAILDYGFRVVMAPSFADIFYNNCFKNGILPIKLPQDVINDYLTRGKDGLTLAVDLVSQTITDSDGAIVNFTIDEYSRNMLLEGLDEIGLTIQYEDAISAYENRPKPY
ncbi:MAG TPA: 3-isopropylmalate dehydratase small subunit [Metalysinibacillus jejuensis]|uniref:3-isopropylmalate dehydratase small subunit n=1 Tax=Metalysinibacillus jejuensis TaxID=914327 RepID=A0A921T4N0_9BACL|nr:3-isopropylmalate dehydratase small subunit [Metalysinibacillus jejuensis]HJH10818.1 3-isopropylmalate dehydratase small subunit [Metalysinibacillus jejuensis]